MVVLVLDAGHGGHDSGATGYGLKEKSIALDIVKGIKLGLEKYGNIDVILTRTNDTYLTLEQRVQIEKKAKANMFVSVHLNAGGGTGFESYVDDRLSNDSRTVKRQRVLHDAIMKELHTIDKNLANRGTKKANYYVIRNTNSDAVLTENLFIDTKKDTDLLKKHKTIQAIINGHVKGIVKIFNLRKKVVDAPIDEEEKEVVERKYVYRVVAGAYKEKKNATTQVTNLKKKSVDSFIIREGGLYKVVAGSYNEQRNAKRQVNRLKDKGIEAFIQKY